MHPKGYYRIESNELLFASLFFSNSRFIEELNEELKVAGVSPLSTEERADVEVAKADVITRETITTTTSATQTEDGGVATWIIVLSIVFGVLFLVIVGAVVYVTCVRTKAPVVLVLVIN